MQVQSTNPQSIIATNYSTPATGAGSSGSSGASAASSIPTNDTPTESMFLQLLVAQMKYQDPTSPQDPSQFVAELANFSQVEQTLAIRQDADTIVQDMSTATATTASNSQNAATPQTQSTNATTAS